MPTSSRGGLSEVDCVGTRRGAREAGEVRVEPVEPSAGVAGIALRSNGLVLQRGVGSGREG